MSLCGIVIWETPDEFICAKAKEHLTPFAEIETIMPGATGIEILWRSPKASTVLQGDQARSFQ